MNSDAFYVGWQDQEPPRFRKVFLWFFGVIIVVVLSFAWLFVHSERGFVDSYFDFGHLTEKEGRLVFEPVPGLVTTVDGERKTIPLVGFGKFGARPVLDGFRERVEGSISDYQVTLRGTLFQYKDKVWMELTEGEASILSYERSTSLERKVTTIGQRDLVGEIVDPKCFFGVMNPATKAVHRSCAIRCISGGAPPVLGLREGGEFVDYYFLLDDELNAINAQVLAYVGLPVQVNGTVVVYDDWKALKISSDALKVTSAQGVDPMIAVCTR